MADLFAPKLQSEVAYERPVEQPSMLGALAGLGGDFLQSYSASQRRSGGASGSTKVDPQLGTFAKGLERVEAIRNEKGEQAALIAERQLATNFAMQGVEFDTDYQNVYTKTTGRVWAGYGRNNEDFMREQALQDPQVQASYVASYALLPQDSTDEQRIEYAIGQKATLQASADVIARSKAEQGYQWSVQTEAAYGNAIDTFLNTNLGALVSTQKQGGTVGPQALANLGASWSQLKVGVSRPSGVSDDQWKSTQAKITSIDNLLTTLTKASSSDVLFEEITRAFASALIAEGGGSTESILAAASAIKDPASLRDISGLSGRVDELIMKVGRSLNLEITQPQLFGHIAEQTGLGETVGGNITLDKLPASIASKVEGLSPQQFYDGLEASGQLTKLTDASALQRPEGRQQFVENSAGIGAVLMGMGNDDFLSASFLKELVGNRQFIQNVKTLDSVDPEGATVARTYVRSGLNTELVRQQRNLAAIDATSVASWNGSNYVIDQDQLRAKTATSRVEGFNRSMQKYYGGDVVAGIRDGFRGVIGDGYTDVVQLAGLYNLEGALDRRDAIGVINDTLKGLAVEEPAGATSDISPSTITGFNLIADDGAFLGAVETTSQNLGINSADLLTAISFETVGTFRPDIKNPGSTATGLIQFLESTAKGLGTSTSALAKMSRVEQMEYVEKYLRPFKGRMKNLGDVYMAIHWPAGVGKDDSYVMYREGSNNYAANKGLDVNGDGTVTRGESLQRVRQSAGSGGQGGMAPEQRITTTELPPATTEGTTSGPASVPVVGGQGGTPVESVQATADLPEEAVQRTEEEAPATRTAASGPTTPPEITALIQALGSRTLSEEEISQLDQYIAGLGG
jgi:hypothetical protein